MRNFLLSKPLGIFFLFSFFTLAAKAQKTDESLKKIILKNSVQLRLSPADVDNAIISSSYTDAKTNIEYVYLQQAYQNIKVFNSIMTIIFRDNEVLYSSGKFVGGMELKAGNASPSLPADQAVGKAAQHLQLPLREGLQNVENKFTSEKKMIFSPAGIAKKSIETELFWVVADDESTVRLSWNVNIDVLNSPDWWNVRVDAFTGEVIEKNNWTVSEAKKTESDIINPSEGITSPVSKIDINQADIFRSIQDFKREHHITYSPPTVTNASYFVVPFPYESPKHSPAITVNEPWLNAGVGNNATTNGWHFDGTTNYNITRGNNVFAYLDVNNNNTPSSPNNWPDTSTTADPSLSFNFLPSYNLQPGITGNKRFAVANLFYWNNLMHDVMYQYGFNEVSGNFQTDNIGRGGTGNDYVQAEAQDASGTDNANFSTPADGARPRMQMFLFAGVPNFVVNAPSSIAGAYFATESGFSTNNKLLAKGPITAQVAYYDDDAAGTSHFACGTPGVAAAPIAGKIAMIIRGGGCVGGFVEKVKNAQVNGAVAVIMVNNVPGFPITMGGTDNTITIPAVMISADDGAILAAKLNDGVTVTIGAGVNLDGDVDNGVVCHEYGHGISNRLTGGPANASCLNNAEQGGEGWSDFLALMMTTNWATAKVTDGALARPMGVYVEGQPLNGTGIRTFPYSTNMTINPHTYADLVTNTEVHYIGEVWCMAIWEMAWSIIQQEGSITPNLYNAGGTGGNVIALQLVMEGMRLQSCRPGFLDARNAILAADSILYNSKHKCAIWSAFAKRGMGFSAVQGSSNSATDQVAAFDVPSSVYLTKLPAPTSLYTTQNVTLNLKASCQCQVPLTNYTIRDTIPEGFAYVGSTGGTLTGNVVTFSAVNFATTQESKSFSITLKAMSPGCDVDTVLNDDRDANTKGGFATSRVSGTGTAAWSSSTVRYASPTHSWFAPNATTANDFALTSDPANVTAGNLSVLSFWHYFVTENYIDGGRVEISPDNGTTWVDAAPYIVQNGYNTTGNATSPWGNNQQMFSGVSYGQGSGQFINTVIDLSSFNSNSVYVNNSKSIKVRFRMRTSANNAGNSTYEGWFVDSIQQLNGCGGIIKSGLYNPAGNKIDSMAFPVFVRTGVAVSLLSQPADITVCAAANNQVPLPVSFTASASGAPSPAYQWQVSTDGGTTFNNIAGQTSALLTLTGVTSSMNKYQYRLVVSNVLNSIASNAAVLTVNASTAITTQPSNATLCANATLNLAVAAAGAGLNYQWQVSTNGGTSFSNITGANSATLTLPGIALGMNANQYRVIITGSCGTVNSNAVTLTVNPIPAFTFGNIPSRVCISDTAFALNASLTTGTWSGIGVRGNKFDPHLTAVNSFAVTYTVTNNFACNASASTIIKVEECAERHRTLVKDAILIYPNPNKGLFNIRVNSDLYNKLEMRVYASDGSLVRKQTLDGIVYGRDIPINFTRYPAGAYYLWLTFAGGVHSQEKAFTVVVAGK